MLKSIYKCRNDMYQDNVLDDDEDDINNLELEKNEEDLEI